MKLDDIGILSLIKNLSLANNILKCYNYDQRSKLFLWKRGYKDGRRLISQYEFPVIYFDGLSFLDRSTVSWIAAVNLRAFDVDNLPSSLTPNLR